MSPPRDISINEIHIKPGHNPRHIFSESGLAELADSIREHGVMQSIVIRPKEGEAGYWLIAGERRYRAAQMAGLSAIPAIVRAASDAVAKAMAVAENLAREDMTPAEESRAAAQVVSGVDGDKAEAIKLLGWTRSKLDARLALMHCTAEVLDALEQQTIKLGHAELLAGLPDDLQAQSLPGILDNGITVAALKESVARYAYQLTAAPFDTHECTDCPHNSGSTADLFDTQLGEGQCLNRPCYDAKTTSYIEQRKAALAEQFPVVFLDTERTNDSYCFLQASGTNGVGENQYSQCQACARHGALIDTSKGREGTADEGVCFDMECHAKKVQAQQAMKDTPAASSSKPATTTKAKGKTAKNAPSGPVATPKRVQEYADATHRHVAGQTVKDDPQMVRVFIILSMLKEAGVVKGVTAQVLKKHGIESHIAYREQHIPDLYALSHEAHLEIITALSSFLAGEMEGSGYLAMAKTALQSMHVDLSAHITVDRGYIETLTVAGITALLTESGFATWFDATHGKGSMKGFLKGRNRTALIDAIIDAKFDWSGFVPATLQLPPLPTTTTPENTP